MRFIHHDLGNLSQGQTVIVTLKGNAANVLLLDDTNFSYYRSGRSYHYKGGHVTRSPYRVNVPSSDHWHIVVNLGGSGGQVESSVRVV